MKHKCLRCGHTWEAAGHPKACPQCKSNIWNVPKKNVKEEEEDAGQEE